MLFNKIPQYKNQIIIFSEALFNHVNIRVILCQNNK